MAIYENPMASSGEVQLWLPVVEGSMRLMAVTSPRTSQLLTGLYFEVETPEGARVVWKMRTPGVGEKIFERPERYEEQAYRKLREMEKEGKRVFVINGEEKIREEKRDDRAEAAVEEI